MRCAGCHLRDRLKPPPTSSSFTGAYYGNFISINEHVDLIFEAGETLNVEIGVPAGSGGVNADPRNRFGVTGYLVDVTP